MKKWAIWKTILVVISAIIVIAGVTVGGVFLVRGNGQDLINPENISFSLDEPLYNDTFGQFEVTEDFQLVLKSDTANVTQKKVTLSFAQNYTENLIDGTITDNVIIVPKEVTLGTPFDVKLNRGLLTKNGEVLKDGDGKDISWINGGISNLIATSENRDIRPTTVRIAVDVPVYEIEVEIVNMNGNVITQVTEGKEFYAQAKFFPEKSRYLYSDNLSQSSSPREKSTYFEALDTTEVEFNYNANPYFVAGSPSNENHIVGYTFKHADKQQEIIGQFSQTASGEELYNTILSYLSSSSDDSVTNKLNPTNIVIIEATIDELVVLNGGHTLNEMYVGSPYTLTVKQDAYSNASLDASVTDGEGNEIISMLKNIALHIEYRLGDFTYQVTGEQLTISGGAVITIDGKDYILPNATVGNPKWEFYSSGTYNFEIRVVLLEEDITSEVGYKLFAKDEVEQGTTVYINSLIHAEKDLDWNNSSDISMTLEFNGKDILPSTVSLDGRAKVPEGNIYQSGIYFASFNSPAEATATLGNNYVATRSGEYIVGSKAYQLYALSASELTVINTGEFDVYYMTVQTDAQGRFVYDDYGLYMPAQITLDPIHVKVSKTLHQGSVESVDITPVANEKPIYLYEGTAENIVLTFAINSDSREVFAEELVNNQIRLNLFNAANDDISSMFTSSYNIDEINGTVIYTLKIGDSLNLNSAILLNSVSLYDNVSDITWNFEVNYAQINIYTPQVKNITLSGDITFGSNISVIQTLATSGDSNLSITYMAANGSSQTINSITSLTANILGVTVVDQFDNTQITKFNNGWEYKTDNSNVIVIGQDKQSFSFAGDGTASVWVECQGVSDDVHKLTFVVEAQGILAIEKDLSEDINSHNLQLNTNDDGTNNLSSVSVVKKATKDAVIQLNELVKLYISAQPSAETQYRGGIQFRFTTQFLSKDDNSLLALFGPNGMLQINGEPLFEDVTTIKTYLRSHAIQTIKILHNFADDNQVLNFNIYDENGTGAISIGFNLRIARNISISGIPSSVEAYATTPKAIDNGTAVIQIGDNSTPINTWLQQKFKNYYIVYGGSTYLLYDTYTEDSVGRINENGEFVFDDFWNDEARTYNIKIFADDIDNSNALSFTINFHVLRNIKVEVGNFNSNQISAENPLNILTSNIRLDEVIKLKRLDNSQAEISLDITYEFASRSAFMQGGTGNEYLLLNTANFPFFRYNESYLSEKVTIYTGEYNLGEVEIFYNLGDNFSIDKFAKQIYQVQDNNYANASVYADVQSVGDVDYILVTAGTWMYNTSMNGYVMQVLSYYTENGINYEQHCYTPIPADSGYYNLSFESLNSFLLGLNDKTIYLIVEIRANGVTQARKLLPLIVSSLGMDFIKYDNEEYNTLENAITYPDNLPKEVYKEVEAGQSYPIGFPVSSESKVNNDSTNALYYTKDGQQFNIFADDSEVFGFLYPQDPRLTIRLSTVSTLQGYYANLVHDIKVDDNGIWSVELNHLTNEIKDAVVALVCTISNGTTSIDFYYLLKVTPDTEVLGAVYPFNSGREEISAAVGQTAGGINGINLAEPFGEKTLHNGEQRFNVKVGNVLNPESLKYSYRVNSIMVDGKELTSDQIAERVVVEIRGDYIKITPKVNSTMEIEIARIYDGGVEKTARIIGGEISYKFVLNSNVNYALTYEGDNINVDGNNANVNFPAGTIPEGAENETRELYVKLNSVTSSGTSGTQGVIYGVLQANVRASTEEFKASIDYDKDTAKLTIIRPSYVSQDEYVYVDFYTDYGFLGTLTIYLSSSAQVEFGAKEFTAGSNVAFIKSDDASNALINKVTLNNEEISGYTIESVYLNAEGMTDAEIALAQSLFGLTYVDATKLYTLDNYETLKIMSSTQDFNASFRVTIALGEGRNYSFDMPISVMANITRTDDSAITSESERKTGGSYIAGDIISNLDTNPARLVELYKDKNKPITNFNVYYKWQASSGGSYFEQMSNWAKRLEIKTLNVPNSLSIEVLITIGLSTKVYSSGVVISDKDIYQTFTVLYSFTITPNTTITLYYPQPNSEYEEKVEYLRDGATFAAATDGQQYNSFFISSPTLSNEAQRVNVEIVKEAQKYNELVENFEFKAYLDEMQNISVESGSAVLTTEDNYSEIDMTKPLSFHIGTRSGLGTEASPYIYNDNGLRSYAIIRIICNGVSAFYEVQLESNILSFSIVQANSSNDDEKVETYYVNEMAAEDGANIFIDNRVIEFTLNASSQIGNIISSNYRVVFAKTITKINEDESTETTIDYRIKDLRINADDAGKTKILELGTAWTDYDYLGTYVVNSTNFITNEDGTISFNSEEAQKTEGLYASDPVITSRVQMFYKGYKVDYSYLSDGRTVAPTESETEPEAPTLPEDEEEIETPDEPSVNPNKLTFRSEYNGGSEYTSLADYTTEQSADNIREVASLTGFTYHLNNGQINNEYNFSTSYNYTIDIDIDIGDEFKDVGDYSIIYANQQINSIIDAANIHHPSSGLKLERSELNNSSSILSLEVVSNMTGLEKYTQEYQEYGGLTNQVGNGYTYLSIAAVLDEATHNHVLDWRILGHGASNKGNFVLLKLVYTASIGEGIDKIDYTKDFYLVYQVLPDYIVTYGNTSTVDIDDNGVIANRTNPYPFAPTGIGADSTYDINIAGVSGKNNVVSVVHSRMSGTPEVAATGFTYTITAGLDPIEGVSYNIPENLEYKLRNALGDWRTSGNDYIWEAANDQAQLKLEGVSKVVFGSQYYQLQAKDVYGYKFEAYFVLQSGGELPMAQSTAFEIAENGKFDISVVYEALSINQSGSAGNIKYDIFSESKSNVSTPDYRNLNLVNIGAWGYLTSSELNPTNTQISRDNLFEESDEKYLDIPTFANTEVTKISWLYNNVEVASISNFAGLKTTLATTAGTGVSGQAGDKLIIDINGNSDSFRMPEANYTMPMLPGYIYGTANAQRVTMLIELTYKITNAAGQESKEIYNLPVEIIVDRSALFRAKDNNVVRDGEAFELQDYILASDSSGAELTGAVNYYNDTIEVSLPAYNEVTMTIYYDDATQWTDTISNSRGYTITQYISISEKLNKIIEPNQSVTITVVNNNNSNNNKPLDDIYNGFLVRYNGADKLIYDNSVDKQTARITISSISVDKINIADSQQLYNNPIIVTKYYLAKYQPADETYIYRLDMDYMVTNNFYSLSTNYHQASYKLVDMFVKSTDENGNDIYTIPQIGWTDGITLNLRENVGSSYSILPYTSNFTQPSIYFRLTDESSSGAATIENGQITTTPIYDIENHFISVAVYCKASGLNGRFSSEASYDKLLGTVTFKLSTAAAESMEEWAVTDNKINFEVLGLQTKVVGSEISRSNLSETTTTQGNDTVKTTVDKVTRSVTLADGSTVERLTRETTTQITRKTTIDDEEHIEVLPAAVIAEEIITEAINISSEKVMITLSLKQTIGGITA